MCENKYIGLEVNWKGQLRRIVSIEKETEKAILAKIRNVRGLTKEEDEERWKKYVEGQAKRLKEYIKISKNERRKKEAEEALKVLQEGWEILMWIPKSILERD